MKRIYILPAILLMLTGILLPSCTEKPASQPNIILFLVDDMGWQDTSLPFWKEETPLNRKFRTPNMERLAAEGMKFTNAYAHSICSPTRISLMTGMNVARHKVSYWTLLKNTPNDGPNDSLTAPHWNMNGMSPVQGIENTVYAKALPEILKESGYYTIHAGKAHFGARDTPAANPENIGFNVNIAGGENGAVASFLGTDNFAGSGQGWDTLVRVAHGMEKYHGEDIFLTEALTLEAKIAMEDAIDRNQPFFMYMSHYAVHVPFSEDKRFVQKYYDAGIDIWEARYAAMIEGMDKSLGDLMDFVEEKGLKDNTIILFMSDNGGLSHAARGGEPSTHNLPLRYGKGSLWEGGIREPMIVYQPGVTAPGSVSEDLVIIEDFFPTILELAGVETYSTPQQVDGVSFTGNLNGQVMEEEKALVWHFPNLFGSGYFEGYEPASAIRKGDWKLIYTHTHESYFLYNIKEDIGEHNNLIDEHRDIAAELCDELTAHLKEREAQMPLKKSNGEPVPWPDLKK